MKKESLEDVRKRKLDKRKLKNRFKKNLKKRGITSISLFSISLLVWIFHLISHRINFIDRDIG